jgi:hypothetical protein
MRAAHLAAILLLAAPRLAAAQADPGSQPPADSAFAEPPAPEVAAPPAPATAAPASAAHARPAPAPAAPPAKGDGAYLGFSFGTGRGDVFAGGTTTKVDDLVPGVSPTTLALMLRGGWASGSLLFGVQLNLVRSQWDVSGVSSAMQLAAFDVVTTLRDHDLGLYVRAGIGPAQLTFEADGTSSQSWNGTEGMLGLGFSSSGFGVGIDYVRQSYEKGAPINGAGYYLATLSLDFG